MELKQVFHWLTVHGKDLCWFAMNLLVLILLLCLPILRRKGILKPVHSEKIKKDKPICFSDDFMNPANPIYDDD